MDADFWRGAVLFLIPFGGGCDQLAVAVAAGDVGHHGRRQGGGLVDFLAAFRNRALVAASDFGLAAAFFAAAFLAGFASAEALAGFAALAFLAPRFGLPPPFATRSSIKAMASGSVMVSCVLSLGIVALTPPAVT